MTAARLEVSISVLEVTEGGGARDGEKPQIKEMREKQNVRPCTTRACQVL